MNKKEILDLLPKNSGAVVILSGGMDSSIATRLCVEKYGNQNVTALTFDYNQKQKVEIKKASEITEKLKIDHKILDLSILGEINKGFSANVDTKIKMPSIKDVLGDPAPLTYVANRNMILMAIAASYAETIKITNIVMGLQVHDQYCYHDTTETFIRKVNDVLSENRKCSIKISAPFYNFSKKDELELLLMLDGSLDLLKHTITCYNPNKLGESCGKCPSCSERINAFMTLKKVDPINYSINIPW